MNRLVYLPGFAVCGAVLLLAFGGCAGDLNPALFPGGNTGLGGSTGTGGITGSGGSSQQVCDAPTTIFAGNCAFAGCHDANGASAGLNLTSAGIVGRLLDVMPNPALSPSCGASTEPYLKSGSNPATGLLLDKLVPAAVTCGDLMPQGSPVMISGFSCVAAWATAVTTGVITQ
jgi:hypothetical protein